MTALIAELLLDEAPDAVIATSPDGTVRTWNRGASAIFGYSVDETVGRSLDDLIVPAERLQEEARIRNDLCEDRAAIYESMRRRKDGSLLHVDISARRCSDPSLGTLNLYCKKDVTELKVRRDAKLVQASFGQLLDSTPDGIVLVNATGRIVLANRQATSLFGYQEGELLGKPIEHLLPERLRHAHVAHRAAYIAVPRVRAMGAGLDLFGLRKNGEEFPLEISLSPLHTDEGMLIFSAIRDITERKRIENALRDTNAELERASAAKDRFLAGMSHELRTPLNAIIGFTGTLLMRLPGPLNEDQERHLQTVKSSAAHLLSLINDLLDLAKIDAGKRELLVEWLSPRSLLEEIRDALRLQAERKGLQLEIDCETNQRRVRSDERVLRQVLLNLAHNAIKFTDRGGVQLRFRISAEGGTTPRMLVFEVIDSGIGIGEADQQRLFEAFARVQTTRDAEREGTGLGLHLSRKLIHLLGGEIHLRSAPGEGSSFRVELRESV